MKRPKPMVLEQDGIKVAVAVQVTIPRAMPCACDDVAPRSPDTGMPWLDAEEIAHGLRRLTGAAGWCLRAIILATGRPVFLGLNVLGVLGANVARGYLLGWASLGGTHRQLSRRLSPWLPEARTSELPQLVAEVLERPKSVPPALAPHADVTWTQLAAAQHTEQRRLKP